MSNLTTLEINYISPYVNWINIWNSIKGEFTGNFSVKTKDYICIFPINSFNFNYNDFYGKETISNFPLIYIISATNLSDISSKDLTLIKEIKLNNRLLMFKCY